MSWTIFAVLHGTVLFSTKIAPVLALTATSLTTISTAVMSVAQPAPTPVVFVGVLTQMNIMSASAILFDDAVVKVRLGSLAGIEIFELRAPILCTRDDLIASTEQALEPSLVRRTMLSNSGSLIGRCAEFHRRIRNSSRSITVTRRKGFFNAMTAAVGTP